uniref:WGS project CAEQ00000000 data, annotated contig 1956 n=1 Tax=Trypanosoma congolense (strain IL3000) TaxID=1068625 RepID=F9WAD2_TRYCI|nr:unnamed protein product [Trypanosoma congolense IL3000]
MPLFPSFSHPFPQPQWRKAQHTQEGRKAMDPRVEPAADPEEGSLPTGAVTGTPGAQGEELKPGGGQHHGDAKEGGTRTLASCITTLIPPGGMVSTVFNLSSICIGAGILGLPAAANSGGLIMAFIYPLIIVLVSVQSLYCIAAQVEKHSLKSYEGMARVLLGPRAAYAAGMLRVLNSFGACVAFVISVADILVAILQNSDAPDFLKSVTGNRLLTLGVWLCCMLPLVIPRQVDSLRYISTVGIIFCFYLMGVIVVHSCTNGLPENIKKIHLSGGPSDDGIHLFGTGNKAIEAPGVFTFAFLCQAASIEVYSSMTQPSVTRFTLYSAYAMAMCFVLYVTTAFFGYLDFGSKVTGSVLPMYDPVGQPAIMIGYIGLVVKLCASYALLMFACRNGIYNVIGRNPDTVVSWEHCLVAVVLSTITLVCGLFIPNINTVFGFVGAVCGGFLAFIFPALFMMYGGGFTLQKVGPLCYTATYALLISGVVLSVFGTVATIYGVATGN